MPSARVSIVFIYLIIHTMKRINHSLRKDHSMHPYFRFFVITRVLSAALMNKEKKSSCSMNTPFEAEARSPLIF